LLHGPLVTFYWYNQPFTPPDKSTLKGIESARIEQHNVAQQPCDDPKSITNNVVAFKPEYFKDAYTFPSDK